MASGHRPSGPGDSVPPQGPPPGSFWLVAKNWGLRFSQDPPQGFALGSPPRGGDPPLYPPGPLGVLGTPKCVTSVETRIFLLGGGPYVESRISRCSST